jgi:uncharacterized protein
MEPAVRVENDVSQPLRYLPATPWGALSALVATAVVIAVAYFGVQYAALRLTNPFERIVADPSDLQSWVPIVVTQVLVASAAWGLSGWFKGHRTRVLALAPPYPSPVLLLAAFVMIMTLSLVATTYLYQWRPRIVEADVGPFINLVRSSAWPIYALVIIVGAAVSEELLFRGFLQSALAQSPLGFVGASLVTTSIWTLLHVQYSIWGLAEVFVLGLIFCGLLWRTGSLWTTLLLHALYNGTHFVGMRYGLFPWTALMPWIEF